MNKETKEQIKKLKKENKYGDIYLKYGSKEYVKNTPRKIKKHEIKKLFSEGKYIDIYNKYGEEQYNKILVKAMYKEIKDNTNILKAVLWRIKENMIAGTKNALVVATGVLTLAPPSFAIMGAEYMKEEKEKNSIVYEKEIEKYNEKISKYAEKVKSMNLNDVQTYMKVMDDMWGSIKGYGEPKKDIKGYLELDLATEDGYGVCRNMANDIAKKLNAINPEYNARTMIVQMDENGNYTIADIKRNFVVNDEKKEENSENEEEQQDDEAEIPFESVFGNHLVTLVDSPEDNLILVLDPTNPGIGIYKDGKITMLNSDKKNGISLQPRRYVSSFMTKGGLENISDVVKDYVQSFEKSNLTFDQIEEKYGLEAQNKSLNYIRQANEKDEFVNSLKVENQQENAEKNNITNEYENKNKEISQEENER